MGKCQVVHMAISSLSTQYYSRFVHMPNPKEAKKAIRDLDGWHVAGQRIHVGHPLLVI